MSVEVTTVLSPGDLYLIDLPPRAGSSEQHGVRPCVVMSRKSLNGANTVVIVPLSTNTKKARAHNIAIPVGEMIRDLDCVMELQDSVALCGQLRVVDKTAFVRKIGKVSTNAVLSIQLGIMFLFDLPQS